MLGIILEPEPVTQPEILEPQFSRLVPETLQLSIDLSIKNGLLSI